LICPECGTDNREDARFCELCYRSLVTGEQPARRPSELDSVSSAIGRQPPERFASLDAITSVPRKRKMKPARKAAWFGIVSAAVIAVIAMVLIPVFSKEEAPEKPKKYDSKISALSFEYPGDWEKVTESTLKKMTRNLPAAYPIGNEIVLMKPGAGMFDYMLLVTSRPADYGGQEWSAIEDSLASQYRESAGQQGVQISFFKLNLPAESGAQGFGISYRYEGQSMLNVFQLEAQIVKGDIEYTLFLLAPYGGEGPDEGMARLVFRDIISSIRFK